MPALKTVIKNATVVTGNSGRDVIYDGAVAIDEDKILSVGPSSEIEAAHQEAATIDGQGKAIFPGLVNCHTHLLATLDRGILEDFGSPSAPLFWSESE